MEFALAKMERKNENTWPLCAVSSVVEHHIDTVGVTGSNPVSRTIFDHPTTRMSPGKILFSNAVRHFPSYPSHAMHRKPIPCTMKNSTRNGDLPSFTSASGLRRLTE